MAPIARLGIAQADVMGYSLGGGVALRTTIQQPSIIRRLAVVSAPCRRNAWHPEQVAAFAGMGPEMAEALK